MSRLILKTNEKSLVTLEENGLVKKTVLQPRHSGFRTISAEKMVDREIKALQLLEDVQDIQKFVSRDSPTSFYSKYIDAKCLLDEGVVVDRDYFCKLENMIYECQKRGVYLLGSNRRDHLILSNGNPSIIDFGNILFREDSLAAIVIPFVKAYTSIRIADLRKRHSNEVIGRTKWVN